MTVFDRFLLGIVFITTTQTVVAALIVQRQPLSDMSPEERRKKISYFGSRYDMEMAYFESPQIVQMGDREVQGLGLSEEILEKFYRENAVCWYPGL